MKYFPKTISSDLIEIKPLSPCTIPLFYVDFVFGESEKGRIIRENKIRQAKLDAICNDTEFVWLDEYNEPSYKDSNVGLSVNNPTSKLDIDTSSYI